MTELPDEIELPDGRRLKKSPVSFPEMRDDAAIYVLEAEEVNHLEKAREFTECASDFLRKNNLPEGLGSLQIAVMEVIWHLEQT